MKTTKVPTNLINLLIKKNSKARTMRYLLVCKDGKPVMVAMHFRMLEELFPTLAMVREAR